MYYQRALKTHDATYLIIAECNFALLSVVEKERLEQTETALRQIVVDRQDSFHPGRFFLTNFTLLARYLM